MGWERKNEPTIHRTFLTLISYVWILHVTVQQAYARVTGPALGTLLKTPRRLMQTIILSRFGENRSRGSTTSVFSTVGVTTKETNDAL